MFLAQSRYYGSPPLVPFTPFGSIALKDCTLDVQLHASCAGRHALSYVGMPWNCGNNITVFQSGRTFSWATSDVRVDIENRDVAIPYDKIDHDRDRSQSMTRSLLLWLRDTDSYPVAEQAICRHSWIADDDEQSSDEESDIPDVHGGSSVGGNVGRWLSKGVTTRSYSL